MQCYLFFLTLSTTFLSSICPSACKLDADPEQFVLDHPRFGSASFEDDGFEQPLRPPKMAADGHDDRLPTLFSALDPSSNYFSLEFFPPKTESGFLNLRSRLARMSTALRPLFVTVTWGAGGSTASKSLELAEVTQRQLGLPTVLHLTCTNMSRSMVDEALEGAKEIGIRNILALRGDPPREEYKDSSNTEPGSGGAGTESNEEFTWAVDLVRYVKKKHGDYFAIGVAGYPEGHADESNPEEGKQSVEHDLPYLVEKTSAGADFIMTQLTYDIQAYRKYEDRLRNYVTKDGNKLFEKIPIIPGLMPIQSYQLLKRITKLSHAKIPEDILKRIEAVKADDEAVKKVGVDIMSEIVEEMKTLSQPNSVPRGFHFYTLNLEKSVSFILERTGLLPSISSEESTKDDESDSEAVAVDSNTTSTVVNGANGHAEPGKGRRRRSSVNAQPHNRVITDRSRSRNGSLNGDTTDPVTTQHSVEDRGTGIPASAPTRRHNLLISEGQGALGREANWDEFPNGRWGPSHSPAFGEIDGYGPSLKVSPLHARKLWGQPKSIGDLEIIFKQHMSGELAAVPWSDDIDSNLFSSTERSGALRAETDVIRKQLLALITDRKYLTLASQPAVDGALSSDPIFGWGPPGKGFVFQKAFVEFFCRKQEWESSLKNRLSKHGREVLGWMKTDAQGVFESSEQLYKTKGINTAKSNPMSTMNGNTGSSDENTVNAVTWGVFPSREILTPTIIEAESFRAWAQESYTIWNEWKRCFTQGSAEADFLAKAADDYVLVNVVGQDFRGGHDGDGGKLWRILLGENE